jgi:hypothetical protein
MTNVVTFYPWALRFTVEIAHLSVDLVVASANFDRKAFEDAGTPSDPYLTSYVRWVGFNSQEDAEAFKEKLIKLHDEVWVKPFRDHFPETSSPGYVKISPEFLDRITIIGDDRVSAPLRGTLTIKGLKAEQITHKTAEDLGNLQIDLEDEEKLVGAMKSVHLLALQRVSRWIEEIRIPIA